jgi:hypothetical protein
MGNNNGIVGNRQRPGMKVVFSTVGGKIISIYSFFFLFSGMKDSSGMSILFIFKIV